MPKGLMVHTSGSSVAGAGQVHKFLNDGSAVFGAGSAGAGVDNKSITMFDATNGAGSVTIHGNLSASVNISASHGAFDKLTGDGSQLTGISADNLDVDASTNTTLKLVMVEGIGADQEAKSDADIEYNATDNVLTVPNLAGTTVTGSTSVTTARLEDAGANLAIQSGGTVDIDADGGALSLDGSSGINIGTEADVAIDVDASTFDLDASAALTMTSTTMALDPSSTFDLDAAGAITIDGASVAIGGDSDTGAVTVDSTAGISLDAGAASNFTTSGGALTLKGATGETVGTSGQVTALLGDLTVAEDVRIAGNLDVQGTVTTINSTSIGITGSFTFEGSSDNDFETTLGVVDPTADRTVNIANANGTLIPFAAASTTQISATPEELNLLDGVSGLVQADFTKLAAVDATAAELNIMDGDTSATSTTVVDADRVVLNDDGTMVQAAVTDLDTYFSATTKTLTNKTIDADNNTLSNIEVDNFKADAIVTESDQISSNDNDTTIPTSAAVKDYVDNNAAGISPANDTTDTENFLVFANEATTPLQTPKTNTKLTFNATGNDPHLMLSGTLFAHTASVTDLNAAVISGSSNSNMEISSDNDLVFVIDANNSGTQNYTFKSTTSSIAEMDDTGSLQLSGGLSASLGISGSELYLDSVKVESTAAELNLLNAITRGSILFGNSSNASAELAKGSANTVLSSDGTDISYTQVSTAMIAADAITGAKLADDSVDSEHLVDGSIDTAHLAADAVTGAKIADDTIDSEHLAAGSIDTEHIADSQVTNAKLAGSITIDKIEATDLTLKAESFADDDGQIPTTAAVKQYVDSVAQGLDVKKSVRVATTAAGTLASSFENGDTIDGVTLTTGDRILIKDQADASENGIYVVEASGAPTRATDFDSTTEVTGGAFTFVEEGTVNADAGFVMTENGDSITVGTDDLEFSQFSGAGSIEAGAAMSKTGSRLDVEVDDSSIEVSSDALQVKASGITNAMLAGSIANAKLANSTISGVALGGTLNALSKATNSGLAMTSYTGTAAVSDLAMDMNDLASATIAAGDSIAFIDADGSNATKKGTVADLMSAAAGDGLAASSGVLSVGVDDSSIETSGDALQVKASGITNAMLAGSIANGKLANSTVAFGGVSLALGGTDATPAFNLSDATAYPGDTNLVTLGTITTGTWNATDIGVAHGGTGASTASDARTNLGLAIGIDVQAYDAELAELATMASNTAAALADLTNTEVAFLDGATAGSINNSKAVVYGSAGEVGIKQAHFTALDGDDATDQAVMATVAGDTETHAGKFFYVTNAYSGADAAATAAFGQDDKFYFVEKGGVFPSPFTNS